MKDEVMVEVIIRRGDFVLMSAHGYATGVLSWKHSHLPIIIPTERGQYKLLGWDWIPNVREEITEER